MGKDNYMKSLRVFLGAWLNLLNANIKYVPNALFGYVVLTLFLTSHFSTYEVLHGGLYAFLGYWLYCFINSEHLDQSTHDQNLPM
jgi:hypothetical protein